MSQISKQALIVENNTNFPNNNTGYITPSLLREFNTDLIDSTVNETSYNAFTASVTASISLLNAFTASQQPAFNALNTFTSSQLVVNSGVNSYTQSTNGRIDATESDISQLQSWSGSVNEIRFNGSTPQYSTRLSFGGFISASFVPNVNGLIADINVLNDPSKLNTSSFNAYTASNDTKWNALSTTTGSYTTTSSFNAFTASQNSFNVSATASITELLDFSSSLSGGFATQGELDSAVILLQNNIDTKLNTSSFNAYTQSFSQSVATDFSQSYAYINDYSSSNSVFVSSSINTISASIYLSDLAQTQRIDTLATTGSNTFIGSEIITGSLTITGSAYFNVISTSIVSSTASFNFGEANFFTVTIPSGSNTFFNVNNVKAGQTALIEVNTLGINTTASFSTNVYQPSASFYVPSGVASSDILTFSSFNGTKIYLASVKRMSNNY